MDEDPLQRRIYFLTFIDSLDMVYSQYIETCEVIIDYPKKEGTVLLRIMKKRLSENFLMQTLMYTAED